MTKYLMIFPSRAMNVADNEWEQVGRDAHAVAADAKAAGVWVFGGGLDENVPPVLVAGDGTITPGAYPEHEPPFCKEATSTAKTATTSTQTPLGTPSASAGATPPKTNSAATSRHAPHPLRPTPPPTHDNHGRQARHTAPRRGRSRRPRRTRISLRHPHR